MTKARGKSRRVRLVVACAALAAVRVGWPDLSRAESPRPVTSETIEGEWVGLVPDANLIVVLRVAGNDARLAIARQDADSNVASAHRVDSLRIAPHDVRIDVAVRVAIRADLRRYTEIGDGTGTLVLPGEAQHDVYFFYLRDRSWMDQMLELKALPASSPEERPGREGAGQSAR